MLYADLLRSRGYEHAKAVSGDTTFSPAFDALYVGVGGTVKLDTVGGETVTLTVVAGLVPVRGTKVYGTGTSATSIFGLWSQVVG